MSEIVKPNEIIKTYDSQSKRMALSVELMKSPIRHDEFGSDKIYVQGKVSKKDNIWFVDLESKTPTVVLDNDVKKEFELTESPTIDDLRGGINNGNSLISGGSFIWIHQENESFLTLIKRDDNAPSDRNHWTGPAGRCAEPMSLTCLGETNEELVFVMKKDNTGGRVKLIGYYRDENTKNVIVHQKLRQVREVYDSLKKSGKTEDLVLLKSIRGEEDVELFYLENIKQVEPGLDSIVTRVDGQEIDRVDNVTGYFDEAVNTLEIREIMRVNIPEGNEVIKIMDGEVFGRQIRKVKKLEELYGEKMVSALKDYYSRFLGK